MPAIPVRTVPLGRTDEHEFLPAAVEVLESPPSPAGRILAISICALFASAIGWASWAEIDIVAVAEGKVIPSGRTKVVQPLEIGVVKTIAVREGQHVKAGDLLVELDSTATGADATNARQGLSAARLEAARLKIVLGLDDGTLLNTPPEGVTRQEFDLAMALANSQMFEQEHHLASLVQEIERQKSNQASAKAEAAKAREILPLGLRGQSRIPGMFSRTRAELNSTLTPYPTSRFIPLRDPSRAAPNDARCGIMTPLLRERRPR